MPSSSIPMMFRVPWVEPLAAARDASGAGMQTWAFLHSGMPAASSARYSFLCLDPRREVAGNHTDGLAEVLTATDACFANHWVGYFAYELKDTLPLYPVTEAGSASLSYPLCRFIQYGAVLRFDHQLRQLEAYVLDAAGEAAAYEILHRAPSRDEAPPPLPEIISLSSNMTTESYLSRAEEVLEHIHAGTVYQANLTRKWYAEWADDADGFALFRHLCAASPAPYSAYLKFPGYDVISSSPEQFLAMDAEGNVSSRPIKGSAADAETLRHSAKDKAENLMIVDLMRHDLGRGCAIGSVRVEGLFDITRYATLAHMASTVCGVRRPEVSPLELVQHCFPPGSMTGTPKHMAMRILQALEPDPRGIYSGVIGWFGGDGSAELSVVIRTVIKQGRWLEFQTGGGIVADSTPEGEWRETLLKAHGICRALGIGEEMLERAGTPL